MATEAELRESLQNLFTVKGGKIDMKATVELRRKTLGKSYRFYIDDAGQLMRKPQKEKRKNRRDDDGIRIDF